MQLFNISSIISKFTSVTLAKIIGLSVFVTFTMTMYVIMSSFIFYISVSFINFILVEIADRLEIAFYFLLYFGVIDFIQVFVATITQLVIVKRFILLMISSAHAFIKSA